MLERMSFKTFDLRGSINSDAGQRESLKMALKASKSFAQSPEGWLFITGVHGCGKTHLAMAASGETIKKGEATILAFVPALLDHLRAAFSPESKLTYDEMFEQIKTAPILVLDDLAAESSTPWAEDKLYQLIVYRHNLRIPTIITSALDSNEIEAKKPGVGSRLKDQLVVQEVVITGPDYRNQQHSRQSSNTRKHPN